VAHETEEILLTAVALSTFIPSERQAVIFERMASPARGGHVQINAVAGSGKTTTIIQGLLRVSEWFAQSVLFCAFSTDIRDTLVEKLKENGIGVYDYKKGTSGVTVKTNHGIGMAALYVYFGQGGGWRPSVDTEGAKYMNLVCSYWVSQGYRSERDELTPAEIEMVKLCHFARVCLIDPTDLGAVEEMAELYDVELPEPDRMLNGLATVLDWGVDGMPEPDRYGRTFAAHECIDFDDMIYLPWRLGLTLKQVPHGARG
jgi:hypothetical protein